VSLVLYSFLGYPVLVWLVGRFRARPVRKEPITPTVTLLVCAYNEESVIQRKLENCLGLDYPSSRLQIAVVTDGSDDKTATIVSSYGDRGVQLHHQSQRQGKAVAITRVMPLLHGEIVVFTDANVMLARDALRLLVRAFADPAVGGVAGEKRAVGVGEGLYWRYESHLKRCDSNLGSVMGAAGELFAIRRNLFTPLLPDTLLDDFVLSMRLVEEGWRVTYEPEAWAQEEASLALAAHWERRARNTAGGLQAISRLPSMLRPDRACLAWQYYSHRVLRWAVAPVLLPIAFIFNLLLLGTPLYQATLLLQTGLYGLGLVGYVLYRLGVQAGLPYVVLYFCMSNGAALAGTWRHLRGT